MASTSTIGGIANTDNASSEEKVTGVNSHNSNDNNNNSMAYLQTQARSHDNRWPFSSPNAQPQDSSATHGNIPWHLNMTGQLPMPHSQVNGPGPGAPVQTNCVPQSQFPPHPSNIYGSNVGRGHWPQPVLPYTQLPRYTPHFYGQQNTQIAGVQEPSNNNLSSTHDSAISTTTRVPTSNSSPNITRVSPPQPTSHAKTQGSGTPTLMGNASPQATQVLLPSRGGVAPNDSVRNVFNNLYVDIDTIRSPMFSESDRNQIYYMMLPDQAHLVQCADLIMIGHRLRGPTEPLGNPLALTLRSEMLNKHGKLMAGICCRYCRPYAMLQKQHLVHAVQFADSEQSMYRGLTHLKQHIISCPYAPGRTRTMLMMGYPNAPGFQGSLSLENFVSWFWNRFNLTRMVKGAGSQPLQGSYRANFRHDPAATKLPPIFTVPATPPVAMKDPVDAAENTAFEALHDSMSHGIRRSAGELKNALVAEDLGEIPCSGLTADSPLYLQLIEHFEVVRVNKRNALDHRDLFRDTNSEWLTLVQCRFCHGMQQRHSEPDPKYVPPFVIANEAICKSDVSLSQALVPLLYNHVHTCCDIPVAMKRRLLRVMPQPQSADFRQFFLFFAARCKEWLPFLQDFIYMDLLSAAVAPCEDVGIWLPMSLERILRHKGPMDGASLGLSIGHYISRRHVAEQFAGNNDVLWGYDSAWEYLGNRRFRVLVSEFRQQYKSGTKLEKRRTACAVVDAVQRRGGRFLVLDSDNNRWWPLSSDVAIARAGHVLNKGFSNLLYPDIKRKRKLSSPGSNVLECERAPLMNYISGEVRWPQPIDLPNQEAVVELPGSDKTTKRTLTELIGKRVVDVEFTPPVKRVPSEGFKRLRRSI